MFGKRQVRTTKKRAALKQINAAIALFHVKEYECTISLAGAAEGLIVDTEPPHVWKILELRRPQEYSGKKWRARLNETRDWLKHPTEKLADERCIDEFEAVYMLIRAVSKFDARYNDSPKEHNDFASWCRAEGYIDSESKNDP
jgi:hypothetical protein